MTKTAIVDRLGERAVLLPRLIAEALAANDRLKTGLALLQAAARAAASGVSAPEDRLDAERRVAGLEDSLFDRLVAQAASAGPGRLRAPGVGALMARLAADLKAMAAPVTAAQAEDADALAHRVEAQVAALPAPEDDVVDLAAVSALSAARRGQGDSLHLVVMDLHRAVNRLAAETAVEDVDGAKVHHLAPADRDLVRAFMHGLHTTARLAFGHPGLGTTAVRLGERLTIQNDIGETDAHVLVVHVEGLSLTVTYTDVHRRRAQFFIDQFAGRGFDWSPLKEQTAEGLAEDSVFYLITGAYAAPNAAALQGALEFLASRLVFLIDWNKARKQLETFLGRAQVIRLLGWAAQRNIGHRAFLVLGGADLVLEAVRRAAAGRVAYGVRLDAALGRDETRALLERALRECAEGLAAGRSVRLIRDEIQADLGLMFETAESAVLAVLVRHLGLSRELAAAIGDQLALGTAAGDPADLAARSKRLEAKADRLTLEGRDICERLKERGDLRAALDQAEDAMDCLDQCAFVLSLAPGAEAWPPSLFALAETTTSQVADLIRAVEATAHLPEGQRADAAAALQRLEAVAEAERRADAEERDCLAALMAEPSPDARRLALGMQASSLLETATDHFTHAAFALRRHLLEELTA